MSKRANNNPQWVYDFGASKTDGDASMRELLGGKGGNLAEMAKLGLPVPPGFTISTEACNAYYTHGKSLPEGLEQQVAASLAHLESVTKKRFGDPKSPLLVSVRSGGRASMPGMMDTVLNLGLNDSSIEGLARLSGNPRFAHDTHRRFIQMYSDVVLGVSHDIFEDVLENYKISHDIASDTDMEDKDWTQIIALYKQAIIEHSDTPFPETPREQLWGAIRAVFDSWMNERAKIYRHLHDIPEHWGTAVNVQAMVFGNMGKDSATGVCFTRNPSTGDKVFYGEYLIDAQGEDVVAGIRTPSPISREHAQSTGSSEPSLEEAMPDVYKNLRSVSDRLEQHYSDMQDIEFTVENGHLFMLQTRNGKRTASAALKLSVDMCAEGLISETEALLRVNPGQIDQLLHPTLSQDQNHDVFVQGLPASPGAAIGRIVLNADEAASRAASGEAVVLVRVETSPEDIHGMHAAKAIVTARGGMTSHAAVVARGMGRPCVCGVGSLQIDEAAGTIKAGECTLKRGEIITVDGSGGQVLIGRSSMTEPNLGDDFGQLMAWADKEREMAVRANAETPEDALTAQKFGAQGIGLCRTEHMFFASERIPVVQAMILAPDQKERRTALNKLLPMQRADFAAIFKIMQDRPCTIRLLDPPLHEFLPHTDSEFDEIAATMGLNSNAVQQRASELHESNPMLGHRGCRLGITYPEIYQMQVRAIFEAALEVGKELGFALVPEIMVPLVSSGRELACIREMIDTLAQQSFGQEIQKQQLKYQVGAMIELPRAALRADEIAAHADFFSFGTNDLTQTTLGISRDDSARFLKAYVDQDIYPKDPFVSIDIDGVGALVQLAVEKTRRIKPEIKLGVCGEHAGDPESIQFFQNCNIDYVSCSPYRVPTARLAAAHSVALHNKR